VGCASGMAYSEFALHAGLPSHMNWRNHIKVLQGAYSIALSSWLVQRGLLPPSMTRPASAGKPPRHSNSAGRVSACACSRLLPGHRAPAAAPRPSDPARPAAHLQRNR
jgi:hypothetical protein